MGAAWERHAMCESALRLPLVLRGFYLVHCLGGGAWSGSRLGRFKPGKEPTVRAK